MRRTLPHGKWRKRLKIKALPPFAELHKVRAGNCKMFILNIERITQEGLDNSSAKLFPADTVLVAMYGATIGACSILGFEASTNQACAAFLPTSKVLPDYLLIL